MSDVATIIDPADRRPRPTYGKLRFNASSGWWIMTEIPPHVALRLKGVFAQIDKARTGTFTFSDTPMMCSDLDWFTSRYPMQMSKADRRRLTDGRQRFERERDEIETILLPTWRPGEPTRLNPGKRAFKFQEKAIELTIRLSRLLVLDEGGLGKTVTGIGTLIRAGRFPAAVIVEPHLGSQWVERIEQYSNLRAHLINSTTPYDLPSADVYVFRYSNIAGWVDVAGKGIFRLVILDEIQSLRHGDRAAKGRAARAFISAAEVVLGLTATPIYNYGDEMYAVLDYVAPGALGSWSEFCREWCVLRGGADKWIVKDPDALGTYLREQNIVIRRAYDDEEVKAELGDALPQPNRLVVDIPYDHEVEADSLELCRKLAIKVTTGSFVERGQAARELDAAARRITGLAKARHVAAYVRMLMADGEPVLLAGWHRQVYEIWQQELAAFNPVMYTGSESPSAKDKAKQAFISGRSRMMMISLRSGAGLDGLQAVCNTLVVGELDWSPQVIEQLIWRLRRLGQQRWPVNAVIPYADGGSDPAMATVLGLKTMQSRGITDPMKGIEQVQTDESRIKLLAQRYLENQR